MFGDGLLLGLLGSGFTFKEFNYLWSPDFCCSWRYKAPRRRKAYLFGGIALAGALAALLAHRQLF